MEPYQAMTFDNRPRVAQFVDGSPMTDGMANFGAALINAGPAAAQIRRQREAEAMDQLWRQRQYDRQTQQDELARLWHEQTAQRQEKQDALAARVAQANIDNMNADNARQNLGMFGTGVNNAAARGIDLLKLLFHGGKSNTKKPPHIQILEDEEGNKKPYVMGDDGKFHEVPIAGTEQPKEADPAQAADPGWPGAAVVGAGALGAGSAYAIGKKMAGKVAAPATASAAGRIGSMFSKVPGGGAVARALPVVGRGAAALASAPAAIAIGGATAAYQGNKATRADLNPVEGGPMEVIKAYAEGKGIEPGVATKFGKAITTLPFGMGNERYSEAIDRIKEQHINELTQALAVAIPEGDPNKARILDQIRMDAWQNPQRAQQLVATLYQSLIAQQNPGAAALDAE